MCRSKIYDCVYSVATLCLTLLCRFRFPSGVILFLLQGLPVFLVSLLILMPVSFCMSEKVFISPLCSVQFSHSVVSNSLRPMNHSTPGLPVHHQLPEFTQTHVHWVGEAIQPSHPLSSPSPPVLNLSQHQGLFKWVCASHQVAKVLEFQLQYQSFQWTPRTDLL